MASQLSSKEQRPRPNEVSRPRWAIRVDTPTFDDFSQSCRCFMAMSWTWSGCPGPRWEPTCVLPPMTCRQLSVNASSWPWSVSIDRSTCLTQPLAPNRLCSETATTTTKKLFKILWNPILLELLVAVCDNLSTFANFFISFGVFWPQEVQALAETRTRGRQGDVGGPCCFTRQRAISQALVGHDRHRRWSRWRQKSFASSWVLVFHRVKRYSPSFMALPELNF